MIVSGTKWEEELKRAGRSKYKALAQAIREGISSGQLPAGHRLPPVRELAHKAGMTPGTVARAYTLLTDEGRLTAEVGRGTFVAKTHLPPRTEVEPLINHPNDTIADFRSSRVPDVGQGVSIDQAFIRLGQTHRRRHINYPTQQTDLEARTATAGWLDQDRLGGVVADDVILGNGAQNCCLLALQAVLRGNNPVILTEDLSYPGVRHAARLLRAQIVGLPIDEEGIIPEAFEQAYRAHGGQVLLTAAEVHSPTTIQTSLARKQALAAIARKLNVTIIEDDCHTTAPTDIPSYRAMLPEHANVVSSITKSVSGALRFGYVIAPSREAKVLRQVAQSSFYGVAQPILDVCTDLLTNGAAAEIRDKVVVETTRRVRLAVNKLGAWDVRWREDAPFVFLQMPVGWRASGFAMACEKKGILVKPADEFALPNGMAPNAVRLGLNTCVNEQLFLGAMDNMNALLSNPHSLVDN